MKTKGPPAALVLIVLVLGCRQAESNHESLRSSAQNENQFSEPIALDTTTSARTLSSTSPQPISDGLPSLVDSTELNHQPSVDEMLLFFPAKHPEGNWNPTSLKFEDVWITSGDGTRIHGWYCPCENPRAYVLYAHGNAGNLTHRSALLSRLQIDLRVATLIFDYRGYGRSDGRATISGAIADTRAASKFLAQRAGVNESALVLMGRSLGGAVAIQVASDTQPRGLILESTFRR